MSSTSSPDVAFVLVPGSFSTPIVWHKVADILTEKGCTSVSLALKTAGDRSPEPAATMDDDADHIHNALVNILDSGKDVVLVMSSYGGIPGSQAVKGLSRKERGDGKKAVIALVFVAALLVPKGKSLNGKLAEGAELLPPGSDESDPYMHLDVKIHAPATFSDMSEAEGVHYFNTMPPHSRVSFDGELKHEGWKHIPSTYIYTTEDKIVMPSMQQGMLDIANEALRKEGSKEIKTVVFKGSSHVPMLSRPEELVGAMIDAANEAA